MTPELTNMIEDRANELQDKLSCGPFNCPNWKDVAKHCLVLEIRARIDELCNATNDVNKSVKRLKLLKAQLAQIKRALNDQTRVE